MKSSPNKALLLDAFVMKLSSQDNVKELRTMDPNTTQNTDIDLREFQCIHLNYHESHICIWVIIREISQNHALCFNLIFNGDRNTETTCR